MFNMCVQALVQEAYFLDEGFTPATSSTRGHLTFSGVANDSKEADRLAIAAREAASQNGLMFTGLKSTWDKDLGTAGAHNAVEVNVTATDPGGLSSESSTFNVIVNAGPTVKNTISNDTVKVGTPIIINLETGTPAAPTFFEDTEGNALTYTAGTKSSNIGVATVAVADDATPKTLTITGNIPGSATITLRATEALDTDGDPTADGTGFDHDGLGQWAELTFTVTVSR